MATKFHAVVDEVIDGADKKPWAIRPRTIVIHHTGTGGKLLSKLPLEKRVSLHYNIAKYLGRLDKTYVSAHLQISREGHVIQIVNPKTHLAYHAGVSQWFHPITRSILQSLNSWSIGIELLGDGNLEPYSEAQMNKLVEVIHALWEEVPTLERTSITGHQHISPGRKSDPGKYFNWTWLGDRLGFKIQLTNLGRP